MTPCEWMSSSSATDTRKRTDGGTASSGETRGFHACFTRLLLKGKKDNSTRFDRSHIYLYVVYSTLYRAVSDLALSQDPDLDRLLLLGRGSVRTVSCVWRRLGSDYRTYFFYFFILVSFGFFSLGGGAGGGRLKRRNSGRTRVERRALLPPRDTWEKLSPT